MVLFFFLNGTRYLSLHGIEERTINKLKEINHSNQIFTRVSLLLCVSSSLNHCFFFFLFIIVINKLIDYLTFGCLYFFSKS
ncbi:hypothetical protein Hanom_Chr14g01320381 [Helianthus anomalus]